MAINQPLLSVRNMVKAEAAKALLATSTSQDSEINQMIYDVQQWLASDYPWPHLRTRWDVVCSKGARYITFPQLDNIGKTTVIDINNLGNIQVFILWNSVWQPVIYGIEEIAQFNYINSDLGQLLDPIQRWMLANEPTSVKFEIWPMPASQQTLRFVGQRTLTELRVTPLTNPITWDDTATLDLDDQMVAYFVVAEYAMREKKNNAQYFLSLANNRMNQIRRTYPRLELPCVIGGTSSLEKKTMRLVPLVVVGSTH